MLVDNKLVAEIAERHLSSLAVDPDGREVRRRSSAEAIAAGGGPSPGQGGRLSVAKGCHKQKPCSIHVELVKLLSPSWWDRGNQRCPGLNAMSVLIDARGRQLWLGGGDAALRSGAPIGAGSEPPRRSLGATGDIRSCEVLRSSSRKARGVTALRERVVQGNRWRSFRDEKSRHHR